MDYRAIGELIWFSLLGLSVFTVVMGFSIRAFLAPVVREALDQLRTDRDREQQALALRVERMEDRLGDVESQVHRLGAAQDFHRQLEAGKDRGE